MTSYIPEYVWGHIPGTYGEMGLIPWPAHMTPQLGLETNPSSSGIELTKKAEAYVATALAEADGVFFLTIDKRDRQSIATTIERLINMLDDLEDDPDLEEEDDLESSLGWPEARGPSQLSNNYVCANDDRELDTADNEPWLGSSDTPWPSSQAAWGRGASDDREGDDEREDTQTEDDAGGVLFCDGSGAQIAMALLNGLHVGGAR